MRVRKSSRMTSCWGVCSELSSRKPLPLLRKRLNTANRRACSSLPSFFDLVDGEVFGFKGGFGQGRGGSVDIDGFFPRVERLGDPRAQQVAFARAFFAPDVDKRVVFML